MDNHLVISKIKSAINVLNATRGEISRLPERQQRKMPLSSIDAAIFGLEMAKAELLGEPMPVAITADLPADIAEYIDNN